MFISFFWLKSRGRVPTVHILREALAKEFDDRRHVSWTDEIREIDGRLWLDVGLPRRRGERVEYALGSLEAHGLRNYLRQGPAL